MGKRLRRGPLNSYVDPTELGSGSAMLDVSEAVKKSGGYDIWTEGEATRRPKVSFFPSSLAGLQNIGIDILT